MVVTAAAGTGIGFATAKRCAEEGAVVVISDAHARRLEEAADAAGPSHGDPAAGGRLQRDGRGARSQGLYDRAVAEHGRIDVAVNNAGLGGSALIVEMTDEQWATVLDVTLTGTFRCTRAALRHMLGPGVGGHRQQRLGPRLAGPGRAGPLRGGQGRGDGPDPDRARPRGRGPGSG